MKAYICKNGVFENFAAYERKASDYMTLEEAEKIYTDYYGTLDLTDEYFKEEYVKLVTHAIRYAGIRADWSGLEWEEKVSKDESRTNAHNMFLNDVERYAGYLKRNGKDFGWFKLLGQGVDPGEIHMKRKRVGDWACYIALFAALNQR